MRRYLLDTNAVIYLLNGRLASALDAILLTNDQAFSAIDELVFETLQLSK